MREKLADLKKQDAQRLKDYHANRNESDAVKKYRRNVEKRIKELQDLLLTNTDKKHITMPSISLLAQKRSTPCGVLRFLFIFSWKDFCFHRAHRSDKVRSRNGAHNADPSAKATGGRPYDPFPSP